VTEVADSSLLAPTSLKLPPIAPEELFAAAFA
jgi:hypothetical protein